MITKQELIDFEEEVKSCFLKKEILSPIHLSKGNEDQLIEIFKDIKPGDYIFSTHRSHYHALLCGIPKEWVMREILENRSMHFFNKDYNFFSSAIVGGCLSIAVGTALGIKLKKLNNHVYIFVGDMAAESGNFMECSKYAHRHNLPIIFIVEDNGLSTDAPTQKVWGKEKSKNKIIHYSYQRGCPHTGAGQWVSF